MKSLGQVLVSFQKIVNEFDGSVSIKNADGKYFFANESWLRLMKFQKSDVIGKRDDEIFSGQIVEFITKTDAEAREKRIPIQYYNKAVFNGEERTYLAIKWVVFDDNGDPFCYCLVAHLKQDQEKIIALQSKINDFLETKLFEKRDYTMVTSEISEPLSK